MIIFVQILIQNLNNMKKLFLLFVAVLMSGLMYGQFHIGPQIGYTASNLSVDKTDITAGLQNNMVVGVFMRLGKKIYLQPEVNYLTQGSVFQFKFGQSIIKQDVQLKSIQVPLNLGAQLIDLKVAKLRIFGGVTGNFVANKTINTTGNPSDYLKPDNIKDVTFQYQIGAGLDVLMFALDIKYYGGINDLVNGNVTYNSTTQQVNAPSNVFMVTLGWKIL